MKGQWIGEYKGTNSGLIVVNVDELARTFKGAAYLHESNPALASTAAFFETPDKDRHFSLRAGLMAIHPHTKAIEQWDNVKGLFAPNVMVPNYADVVGDWDPTQLTLSWTTNIGTSGSCTLPVSRAGEPSELTPLVLTWEKFKDHVATLESQRYLFRGQNKQWRLRTSYHRAGRADLQRFLDEDIRLLHRHLSARTRHVFNLLIPDENGAFFNLVQHHGYPTPLLDWTHSPYVAAFFAYRGISQKEQDEREAESVRIHVFDKVKWQMDWASVQMLVTSVLHVSVGEFLAIENERMIPQQAASTVTNIDDIEGYIREREKAMNMSYLYAIDLPIRDRRRVSEELQRMGITAGSLFPGLDGACEELRERRFDI